ncbi:hypothetical protein G6F57_021322 [Rhizopus arrhizus]|nr:hypothetical protein G6F57_021322 [Rhizopus arrhizus]
MSRQLFAGAAFADQQGGNVGGRDAPDLAIQRSHAIRRTIQLAESPGFLERHTRQVAAGIGDDACQDGVQPFHADRLDQKVGGSQAQRLDGIVHRAMPPGRRSAPDPAPAAPAV